MSNHVTKLTIDLPAVSFNLNFFKAKLRNSTTVLAVVKAFGYGSDSIAIAKFIETKVSYFAVAYVQEGIVLREAGIKKPILVLHPQVQNLETLIAYNLEPNLYSRQILKSFLTIVKAKEINNYPIHLEFNTGLNRLGFSESDLPFLSARLIENPNNKVTSIFSHLSASEDENERLFTLGQIAKFKQISKKFERIFKFKPIRHLCNTSGLLNYPEAHFDMVRIGIGMYGFGNTPKITSQLKNVISLKSILSQIHQIERGESIGYNRQFIADKPLKTATIPIGHADGIHRSLGNLNGYVTINNQKAAIIGNVCMDMIMVDITSINCSEGDEVVLLTHNKQ